MASRFDAAIIHVRRRLLERYGLTVSRNEVITMGERIKSNHSRVTHMKKLTCSRTHVVYQWHTHSIHLIYSNVIGIPVTALPKKPS